MELTELQRDEQGRYIGDDGFVVPKTSNEFFERFPDWPHTMARKWLPQAKPEDTEDLAQDISMSLLHRRTVERYDPTRFGATNAKLFFSFLVLCSRNVAYSRHNDLKGEPTNNKANVSLDGLDVVEDGVSADRVLHDARPSTSLHVTDMMLLDDFGTYLLAQGHSDLAQFYDLLRTGHTQGEAVAMAGLGKRASWSMERLKKLAEQYQRTKR